MSGKVHPSFMRPENLLKNQNKVWERDYGFRGPVWAKETRDLPRSLEGKTVLEAGAGNGKTLKAILKQNPKMAVAFDFSPNAIKLCRERLPKSPPTHLAVADYRDLPFDDGTFDVLVAYYVLDNLLEKDRVRAVEESYRVLKPGGMLLFSDFAVGDYREETGNVLTTPEPRTHLKKSGIICHFFCEDEVRALFSGFQDVDASTRESTPIRNKEHLVRRTIKATMTK